MTTFLTTFWRSVVLLARRVARQFIGDLPASCFSAALAALALHFGLLDLFTKLSLLAVSNLALAPSLPNLAPVAGPVVLYLSEGNWQQRYLERSPLDRCRMAEDLQRILRYGPRTLTVDFDLSPGLQDDLPACRVQLDAVLDHDGARLVLLAPFRVSSAPLLQRKADWMRERCRHGVSFGDGGLNLSLGVVIDYLPEASSLADAVGERAGAHVCRDLQRADGAERWLRRGAEPDNDGAEALAINFSGFAAEASALALDHPAIDSIKQWQRRDVYFGGDYGGGKDDNFLTPMGQLPGVAIHAAIAWSQAHPVHEPPRIFGFALDLWTAFVFSLGIGVFWKYYLQFRTRAVKQWLDEFSTVIVILFLLYFLVMLFLFFQLAATLFAHGILIAPLLIGLSMLIDGFVRGPIEACCERLHEHEHKHEHEYEHEHARAQLHERHRPALATVLVAPPMTPATVVLKGCAQASPLPVRNSAVFTVACGIVIVSVALGLGAKRWVWSDGASWFSAGFIGANAALLALLSLGLFMQLADRLLAGRSQQGDRPKPVSHRLWPRLLSRHALGVLVFGLRWLVYIAILGRALLLMFQH